ncbi:MAG: homoserine dehydrogenase [Candidatus Saganbacteria bacterium]|nr:homoserine dehydrogenase [Candidatus Saganbacteria bacterium]
MKTINIGIIGLGNIGSALVEALRKNRALIAQQHGIDIRIKKVCDVRRKMTALPFTTDANALIKDRQIDLIVEAVGGVHPAKKFILAALKAGKHVVTPNKEVIAKHLKEILAVARRNRVRVFFEAAVGGGIPIIRPLRESLAGNKLSEVYGIVNGTTNYILSQMTKEGSEFSDALAQAQKKGYAEPDPGADIKGLDAAYKAVILASVAFGADVDWQAVPIEGITAITQEDIQYAGDIGYVIKLLAVARLIDGRLDIRVNPALVPKGHPLAAVSDNFNAIYVKGEPVGELMFYGQGAGGGPTSSAIISDIIQAGLAKKSPVLRQKRVRLKRIEEIASRYYIRLLAPDRFGVLAGIARAFAGKKVSIAAVVQKETVGNLATIVILLDKVPEKNMRSALKVIARLPVVRKVCSVIRIVS